jgi:hypothetical protein
MQPLRAAARTGLVLVCAGGSILGCSASHHTAATEAPPTAPATTPKAAAVALAHRMLDEAALPPGAHLSDVALPELLSKPFQTPAIGNLVREYRLWAVLGESRAIATYLDAHRPGGLTPSGLGYSSSPSGRAWIVDNQLPGPPPNVSYADLQFAVADGGNGVALVRGDAVVGWTAPRPADEFVSARDRVVTVTVVHVFPAGSPRGKRVVTSDPKLVQPIVRAFNRLRVAPPARLSHGCPPITERSVSYRVAFATSTTAAPDIVATIGKCRGLDVMVRGHRAPSLVGLTGPIFLNAVARVLGLSEPHFG